MYRSAAEVGLVPLGPVTVTSTVPGAPGGAVATMVVSLTTVKDAAGVGPNATAVLPVKCVPVTVTGVPPAAGPEFGVTEVTVRGCGTPTTTMPYGVRPTGIVATTMSDAVSITDTSPDAALVVYTKPPATCSVRLAG